MLNESTLPLFPRRANRLLGLSLAAALSAAFCLAPAPAPAKDKPAPAKDAKDKKDQKATEDAAQDAGKKDKKAGKNDKADKSGKADKADKADKAEKGGDKGDGGGKPEQLGTYGEWGAYLAVSGRDKTCYALGQPKDRQPKAKLKDTPGYIFISSRPGEGVRNEVAINLGYATKDGSAATAQIDGDDWELITKGTNAWVKDQGKEKEFVGALRGGAKLVVKAASAKGTPTVDTYALKGLSDALARVAQECK